MSLMEVTDEMQAMFVVNKETSDKVVAERASNTVLDAVDDFCDFIKDLNR